MRLEPVFVAPAAVPPPAAHSRRAFFIGGSLFVGGFLAGGACGFAAGSQRSPVPDQAGPATPSAVAPTGAGDRKAVEVELPKSGDVELDALRRLAVKAPISELMKHRDRFLYSVVALYRNDEILWRGVERIADQALADATLPRRRLLALSIVQAAEGGQPGLKALLATKLAELKKIR